MLTGLFGVGAFAAGFFLAWMFKPQRKITEVVGSVRGAKGRFVSPKPNAD